MHINIHPHPRPLSLRGPYTLVPRHHGGGLVEMTNSEFISLSGLGALSAPSMSAGVVADSSDWDTNAVLEGIFQDTSGGAGFSNPPFSIPTPAPAFGGAYTAFPVENNGSNTAAPTGRGFETQPQQQQQQFSTQMLSYATSKFISRPPPPPSSGYQISHLQTQGDEYWTSLATSTTMGGNQSNSWKMDYNNPILSDFDQQCTYGEFAHLHMQTGGGGKLSSFSLGSDDQSPDSLHFSPNDDGHEYNEKRWSDTLKFHEQNMSTHHGLPYTFYDDTIASHPPSIFPPTSSAHWADPTHLATVSPKALTLSSSSISFSGSGSSDCGSVDSVSTTEAGGFSFHSAAEGMGGAQGVGDEKEVGEEVKARRKLPARPVREYVAIAPSLERDNQVSVARTSGSRDLK
ncbi:hypothetical protein V493_07763, partial [Pseudogymnoascus sp. VKM F-4281 (FW-2241)]